MATLYKKGAGNFDGANGWNSQADGLGTDYTATDSGGGIYIVDDAGNTLDLNGVAVTLNQSVAAALIQSSNAGGYLDVSGTRTINGNVTYSSTSTSGMVRVGTGASLTLNGLASNSSSGNVVVCSGSGALTVSNVGGNAFEATAGYGLSHGSTGSLTITGNIVASSSGLGAYIWGAAIASISGNINNSSSSHGIQVSNALALVTVTGDIANTSSGNGLFVTTGVVSYAGNPSGSASGLSGSAIAVTGGTLTWIGNSTINTSVECYVRVGGGTLALASAGGALTLTCFGVFVLRKYGGTLTMTSGANNVSLIQQISAAQIACIGQDVSAYITGPTIPVAANVRYDIQCGYAGALVTGDLQIPNSSSPTGTQDATSDDCVVSGKKYGSPERTGTAAAGGGGRKTLGALRGT